jgi:hypothetical protein
MSPTPPPAATAPAPQTNTLGNASLGLGIAAVALVFGIGLCAIVGVQQGTWIAAVATPLFVCGASSAFLGLIGAVVGLGGLFGANRSKATAVVGLVLSLIAVCLFFAVLSAVRQ